MSMIPQTDPKAAYLAQKDEIDAAIARVLNSGWYILGKEVTAFEAEFAAFTGAPHAVGVANGTDALVLGLRALGVKPGDKVATVSHTAVATVAAVELVGAAPVLVDVDECFGMDADQLDALLARDKLGAIIPVHLYGQPVAVGRIMQAAARHGVPVLEDCSQAHGATFNGQQVGTFSRIAAYSLYPTKNLGALGDGGVLTAADADADAHLRSLREYGWKERYISDAAGQNSRLDELQAAILRVKLTRLKHDNARRQAIAGQYDRGLGGLNLPRRRPDTTHVFHQYVLRHPDRDGLRTRLREAGVMTNVHYPVPVHEQPAYRGRIALAPGGLPRTEAMARDVLSLPIFPQMTDDQVATVIEAVRRLA